MRLIPNRAVLSPGRLNLQNPPNHAVDVHRAEDSPALNDYEPLTTATCLTTRLKNQFTT
jgi:hypothetical protein